MPRLGSMFFSSAYLVVNHDEQTFIITPADAANKQSSLVGIDTENNCVARLNSTEEIDMPFPTSTVSNASGSKHRSGRLTGGCIAGITLGTAVLIIAALSIAFIVRRRLRPETNETTPVKDALNIVEASADICRHELSANGRSRVTELD